MVSKCGGSRRDTVEETRLGALSARVAVAMPPCKSLGKLFSDISVSSQV